MVRMVSLAPIESRLSNWNVKRSRIEPNSPDNVEEDDDARLERKIDETLAINDELKDSDEDSERTMEDVPIHEEIPSYLNVNDDLASNFALLNICLDSMDTQMMSYGEQIRVLYNWMSSIDDIMIPMKMNQERLI